MTWSKIKTARVFCETSHGKSKSDGLGGVFKSYASSAVCGEREVIRDAKELFDIFNENIFAKAAYESSESMLNRCLFYVSLEKIDEHRATFPSHKYVYIPGTENTFQNTYFAEQLQTAAYEKTISYMCSFN